MTYTAAQIDAAIEAEVRAWAEYFSIEPTQENLEGRRLVMRANVAQGHFEPLKEFLPTDRDLEWDEALRLSEQDARIDAKCEQSEARAEHEMFPEYRGA